ncbi:MAG: sugar phosphate isomerase/epimerase [Phycisphaeraceae bacterium]|nr:sugar phosphate isomerase/epimerase [Phycisphaeraceae bacterium]
MAMTIGLQLYSVRDVYAKDPEKVLAQVAQFGYPTVEFAGLAGKTPQQMADLCKSLKLQGMGTHVEIERLTGNLDDVAADAKTLGYKYVTCPYLPNDYRTPEGYRKAAALLNEAGKRLADKGLVLCYHNHAFEFDKLTDGSLGQEIFAGELKSCQFELDVMWATWGRENPVDWIKKLSGRVPLLHIKDTPGRDLPKKFTEVGTGIVDLKGVLAAAPAAGVNYLIVEQDAEWIDNDPMKSVRVSYENLAKLLKPKATAKKK